MSPEPQLSAALGEGPFAPDAIVLISLSAPREKFWGALLSLSAAGVSARGIDLNSFDDFARQIHDGDLPIPSPVFFPMHRVERIELDLRSGDIPSLRERFLVKTGRDITSLLASGIQPDVQVGCSLAEASERLLAATLAACGDDLQRAAALLGLPETELRDHLPRDSRGTP